MTRAAAEALRLKLFARSSPAAALTAIQPPAGVDSGVLVQAFRESFAAVVANGQGEMKGKLFRIAHLGYYDYLDTIAILGALEQVLARWRPAHVGSVRFARGAGGLRRSRGPRGAGRRPSSGQRTPWIS
jgi:aspartate aminotransferase-like enzyme